MGEGLTDAFGAIQPLRSGIGSSVALTGLAPILAGAEVRSTLERGGLPPTLVLDSERDGFHRLRQ